MAELALPLFIVAAIFFSIRMHRFPLLALILRGTEPVPGRVYLDVLLAASRVSWVQRLLIWLRRRGRHSLGASRIHTRLQIVAVILLAVSLGTGGAEWLAWVLLIVGIAIAVVATFMERSIRRELVPNSKQLLKILESERPRDGAPAYVLLSGEVPIARGGSLREILDVYRRRENFPESYLYKWESDQWQPQ